MSPPDAYRTPYEPAAIELRCPICVKPMFVAEFDAIVGVTECPHGGCQVVSFVYLEPTGLGEVHRAVALADLVRPPPHERRLEVPTIVGVLATFLILPIAMLFAVPSIAERIYVFILLAPALAVGAFALVGVVLDLLEERRQRVRAIAKRRDAIQRVRWLEASRR